MSSKNCSACNDLREVSAAFDLNGVTDKLAANLKANEGLNNSDKRDDCDDLLDINDCLIGNMVDEMDAYDVCEWKDFMAEFIPNLYETLKAMVYSACGQWCAINYMYNGNSFRITEDTEGEAYAVAGKGVSFLTAEAEPGISTNIRLTYIAGGLVAGAGSYDFYNENWTEPMACGNFDNGDTYRKSKSRKGNSFWGTYTNHTGTANFPAGGELICEFRIKNSAYPQISRFFSGFGNEGNGGSYTVRAIVFNAGTYAYGQHGWCNSDTGAAQISGGDAGHLVPSGWTYIQLRMSSCARLNISGSHTQFTPVYFLGVRMNQNGIEC